MFKQPVIIEQRDGEVDVLKRVRGTVLHEQIWGGNAQLTCDLGHAFGFGTRACKNATSGDQQSGHKTAAV